MASSLYWKTGFGWPSISLSLGGLWLATSTTSGIRFAGIAVALMAGLYVVDRFRRCYLLRWGRFHHRGMLAFAGIWGGEVADAKHEGRDPNKARALSMLMRVIDPQAEASQHLVDFADLTIRKGGYFADLLTANPTVLPSQGSAFPLDSVVEHARKLDLSPEMIIARSVERALGEQEAARYAAALLTGKAK